MPALKRDCKEAKPNDGSTNEKAATTELEEPNFAFFHSMGSTREREMVSTKASKKQQMKTLCTEKSTTKLAQRIILGASERCPTWRLSWILSHGCIQLLCSQKNAPRVLC